MQKRLFRTVHDRKLAGVCGGLAAYFGIDPSLVRVLFIILFFLTAGFPLLLGYIAAAFVIPNEGDIVD
ncbi:PspC domain-containing protein [Alkalihalobacterium chitinilyticum]|uniref:PspC domain-containing protein n=1 Tax=Alkalihalobacterium chitinilyticum TaxID=2980103 RepID=A0ABT5VFN5_9BACI|nr:PspC domain-containing protein [Alkalihalobacterium chitinilyticum]MDE5414090.1 PspC domain-containing protein [Alkalihalobacterium chitinilyticum]